MFDIVMCPRCEEWQPNETRDGRARLTCRWCRAQLPVKEQVMIIIKRDKKGNHTIKGIPFVPRVRLYRKTAPAHAIQMTKAFSIETLEGTMEGKAGDWLMVGVNGEMYPCDNGIFLKTYELIEEK